MQARTRRVMDQHPRRITGRLNACQHGIGALGTAIDNGNLWMICQGELREARIAGADSDDRSRHPRVRQQRRHGVLEDRFIANREVLLGTFCLHAPAKTCGRHHGAYVRKSYCHVVILGLIIDCFVLSPDCV